MSTFTNLLSQFQPIPERPNVSRGFWGGLGFDTQKARKADAAMAQYESHLDAVNVRNRQVAGDMVALGGEALQSGISSLGEFARDTLGSLFGGQSTQQTAAVPAEKPQAATAQKNRPSLTPNMGMGKDLLGRGMAGPEVKRLQELLNGQGYNIKKDGIFGPQTEKALKEFQAKQAESGKPIAVDGIVGPETSKALERTAHANEFAGMDATGKAKDAAAGTPKGRGPADKPEAQSTPKGRGPADKPEAKSTPKGRGPADKSSAGGSPKGRGPADSDKGDKGSKGKS